MGNIVDKSEPNSSSITLKKENKGNSQKIDIPSFPNRTQHRDDNIGGTKQRLKKKKNLSLSKKKKTSFFSVSLSLKRKALWWVALSLLCVEMELDKAARFVEDLLDFESDIGEEDEEDDKRRKVLCKHDPTSSAFGVLCPEDATRVLPVSFIGFFFFLVVFWFFLGERK